MNKSTFMETYKLSRTMLNHLIEDGKVGWDGKNIIVFDEEYFKSFDPDAYRKVLQDKTNAKIAKKARQRWESYSWEERQVICDNISKQTSIAMHRDDVQENLHQALKRNIPAISKSVQEHWQNMTDEEYKQRCERISEGMKSMPYEKRILMIQRMTESLKRLYANPDYLEKHKRRIQKAMSIPEIKDKISKGVIEKWKDETYRNAVLEHRSNSSYPKSKAETRSYERIVKKFPDALRQYKCDRYPFNCDIYIPSKDMFIECHYARFHNDLPYEQDNPQHQEWLRMLEEDTKISSYYEGIINTWTIIDVNKREIAKENNLNYFCFYNEQEFNNWCDSL